MLPLILSAFCLIAGQVSGNDAPVSVISMSVFASKQSLLPGDKFEFRCQVTGKSPEDLTQVVRTKVVARSTLPDQSTMNVTNTPYMPFDICNGTLLNPDISQATTRYRVTKEQEGNLVVRINDAQPEDSGHWACRVISDIEGVIVESQEIEITVVGPLESIRMLHKDDTSKDMREMTSEDTIHMSSDQTSNIIACEVNYTNVMPNFRIAIFKPGVNKEVTNEFATKTYSSTVVQQSGLVTNHGSVKFVQHGEDVVNYRNNGARLICKASLKPYPSLQASVYLNITYPPKNTRCKPSAVFANVGSRNTEVTCSAQGNPLPTLRWVFPNGTYGPSEPYENDNVHVIYKVEGDLVTTSMQFKNLKDEEFTTYRVNAVNMYGEDEHHARIIYKSDDTSEGSRTLASIFLCIGIVLTTILLKL